MYLILYDCEIQKKEKCRGQWRIKIKEESKEREKRNKVWIQVKERVRDVQRGKDKWNKIRGGDSQFSEK